MSNKESLRLVIHPRPATDGSTSMRTLASSLLPPSSPSSVNPPVSLPPLVIDTDVAAADDHHNRPSTKSTHIDVDTSQHTPFSLLTPPSSHHGLIHQHSAPSPYRSLMVGCGEDRTATCTPSANTQKRSIRVHITDAPAPIVIGTNTRANSTSDANTLQPSPTHIDTALPSPSIQLPTEANEENSFPKIQLNNDPPVSFPFAFPLDAYGIGSSSARRRSRGHSPRPSHSRLELAPIHMPPPAITTRTISSDLDTDRLNMIPPSPLLTSSGAMSFNRVNPSTPTSDRIPRTKTPELSSTPSGLTRTLKRSQTGITFQSAQNELDDFDEEVHLPPLKIHFQPPKQLLFINPSSSFKILWSVVLILLITYSLFEVPLSIGFDYDPPDELESFSYFIDAFFLLDVVLNFFTGYLDEQLELVHDPKVVALTYLRGWFLPDFIGSIPFDLISAGSYHGSGGTKIFFVLRALKIPRLFRMVKLTQILDIRSHRYLREVIRMVKLVMIMIVLGHWIACGFMLTARSEPTGVRTWADPVMEEDLGSQYVYAVYWSLTVLSTVGFGDIVPLTRTEMIYTCVVMLMGAILYAVIVGNVMLVLANLNAPSQRHTEEIMKVADYMRYRKFPPNLMEKVLAFTEAEWQRMRGYNEREVMSHLPESLQTEIARHLHVKMLSSVSFFKESHSGFINAVVLSFHTAMLLPNTIMIRRNTCLAFGTKLLKYDGSITKVEKIVVGDILYGPNGRPSPVESVTRRQTEMLYRVQTGKYGAYDVTAGHRITVAIRHTPKITITRIDTSAESNHSNIDNGNAGTHRIQIEWWEFNIRDGLHRVGWCSTAIVLDDAQSDNQPSCNLSPSDERAFSARLDSALAAACEEADELAELGGRRAPESTHNMHMTPAYMDDENGALIDGEEPLPMPLHWRAPSCPFDASPASVGPPPTGHLTQVFDLCGRMLCHLRTLLPTVGRTMLIRGSVVDPSLTQLLDVWPAIEAGEIAAVTNTRPMQPTHQDGKVATIIHGDHTNGEYDPLVSSLSRLSGRRPTRAYDLSHPPLSARSLYRGGVASSIARRVLADCHRTLGIPPLDNDTDLLITQRDTDDCTAKADTHHHAAQATIIDLLKLRLDTIVAFGFYARRRWQRQAPNINTSDIQVTHTRVRWDALACVNVMRVEYRVRRISILVDAAGDVCWASHSTDIIFAPHPCRPCVKSALLRAICHAARITFQTSWADADLAAFSGRPAPIAHAPSIDVAIEAERDEDRRYTIIADEDAPAGILSHNCGDRMFFISKGSVELIDRGQVYAVLGEGAYVGESALLDGLYRVTARTASYCELCILYRSDFDRIVKNYPEFIDIVAAQAEQTTIMASKKDKLKALFS